MAKKRRKKSSARRGGGGNPQRAKFRKAAKSCQAKIRDAGVIAFSRDQWTQYGKCMKKAL